MIEISIFTGGIAQTNGYLVTVQGRTFLVDAPEGMTAFVKKTGVKPEALLLTHQHFDHCQDAAALHEAFSLPIYAFETFSRDLTLEFLMGFHRGSKFEVAEFAVDHVVKEGQSLEVAGQSFEIAHIPGHSTDSITFYLKAEGVVFGGDVLFEGSVGRTDFPKGSMPQLIQGIKTKLFTLPNETVVYPGHGDKTTIGDEKRYNGYLKGL